MKYSVILMILMGYIPSLFAQKPTPPVADTLVIKTLFFTGLREKLNEDYSKASETFNKVVLLDPRNASAYYEISVVNYRQDNLIEAEMAIRKATSLDAGNIWYWMMMTEVYKRKGDMDAMANTLDQLIRLSPERKDFYFDRSNAYLLAGKTGDAMKGYDELEKKFGPSDELARARRRVTSGGSEGGEAPLADALRGAAGTTPVEEKMRSAEKLYKAGDLPAALAGFISVLESNDQIYSAWEQALNVQLLLKQHKEAIKTADAALSIYPNQAILYYFMALALHKDLQNAKALPNVKSALELDPENGIYLELYGDILFLNGEKAQAIMQWNKAKSAGNASGKLIKKINEQKYLE